MTIVEVMYYFRWYRFENRDGHVQWFYDRDADQIIGSDSIDKAESMDWKHVPVGLVDIELLEHDYLLRIGKSKIIPCLEKDKSDFDRAFKRYLNTHNDLTGWYIFERENSTRRQKHGVRSIQYVLRMTIGNRLNRNLWLRIIWL